MSTVVPRDDVLDTNFIETFYTNLMDMLEKRDEREAAMMKVVNENETGGIHVEIGRVVDPTLCGEAGEAVLRNEVLYNADLVESLKEILKKRDVQEAAIVQEAKAKAAATEFGYLPMKLDEELDEEVLDKDLERNIDVVPVPCDALCSHLMEILEKRDALERTMIQAVVKGSVAKHKGSKISRKRKNNEVKEFHSNAADLPNLRSLSRN